MENELIKKIIIGINADDKCCIASINSCRFLRYDNEFNVEMYDTIKHAVCTLFHRYDLTILEGCPERCIECLEATMTKKD